MDRELKKASSEIALIKSQFGVENTGELRKKIENGEIEAHPAWEKLIEWKNLKLKLGEVKAF